MAKEARRSSKIPCLFIFAIFLNYVSALVGLHNGIKKVAPVAKTRRPVVDGFHSLLETTTTLTTGALELGQNKNPSIFDPTTGKEVSENFNAEFAIAQAFEFVVGISLVIAWKNGLFSGNEKIQAYFDRALKPGVKSGVTLGREIADARRATLNAEKEAAKKKRRR